MHCSTFFFILIIYVYIINMISLGTDFPKYFLNWGHGIFWVLVVAYRLKSVWNLSSLTRDLTVSPTLQGRFLTTGQTGKCLHEYLVLIIIIHTHKDLQCWSLSRVRLFETPWIVACKPLLPMGFSRQEYWGGLPFPSPGDLPDLGVEPWSPALQADSLLSEPPRS